MRKGSTLLDFQPLGGIWRTPSPDDARKCALLEAVNARCPPSRRVSCILALAALVLRCLACSAFGAGITVITHGFNGNVAEWVIPMGAKIWQ
jgi:hypothetical protein